MEDDKLLEMKDSRNDAIDLVGTQSFEHLRNNGLIYVDKTELLYKLLRPKTGIFFLARPRRF
jgi:hypothetical protein